MIGLPDWILAGMVAEGLGLYALRAFSGQGPRALIANLMSGGCLLLAWRTSEAGAPLAAVCALLGASLIAHGVDLAQRWRIVNRPSET